MQRETHFDYLVIGSGSSGAVVAARLSEDPNVSVCLVEAGKSNNSLMSRLPLANMFQVPEFPGFNNWKFKTTPQKQLNNRTSYHPRGKALGGSSAINGMIYIRGHPDDYDQWADNGCDGWSWKDVFPYFLKSENNQNKQDQYHGSLGELHVGDSVTPNEADDLFLKAAQEAGYSLNEDFNGTDNIGCGHYQLTQFHDDQRSGTRCSTAAAFIIPNLKRKNLTILSGAIVDKLEIEDRRAVAVIIHHGKQQKILKARKEIVLSAGSFGTPSILLRSGIGPAEELKALGIKPIFDKRDVGKNLQDHLQCALHYQLNDKRFMGITPSGIVDLMKAVWRWRKNGKGLAATSFTESGAFLKSSKTLERPDLQVHFFRGLVEDHGRKLHFKRGFSAHVCTLHPESCGEVHLSSPDPMAKPIIDPNYLATTRDENQLVIGMKKLFEICEAQPFKTIGAKALQNINIKNDDEILTYIRASADTAYHPVGTCRMGKDEHAVVDNQLKVRGIESLRVADASIMPSIISGNTNAACIMIGERVAEFLKYER